MNPDGFILEVPAELRMRRKQRKEEDIMYAKAMSSAKIVTDKFPACRGDFVWCDFDRANAR